MNYLLDTCVISELMRPIPNAQVVDWLRGQDPESLYISYLTIGELKKGIAKSGKLWVDVINLWNINCIGDVVSMNPK